MADNTFESGQMMFDKKRLSKFGFLLITSCGIRTGIWYCFARVWHVQLEHCMLETTTYVSHSLDQIPSS